VELNILIYTLLSLF